MKTGTIFVLVAFIIMGLEGTCAQRPPIKGKGAEVNPSWQQRRLRAQC